MGLSMSSRDDVIGVGGSLGSCSKRIGMPFGVSALSLISKRPICLVTSCISAPCSSFVLESLASPLQAVSFERREDDDAAAASLVFSARV
jgi:hypothetical protein